MYFHIILTERCNSDCRYCYKKSMEEWDNGLEKKWKFDFNVPCDFEVELVNLRNFFKKVLGREKKIGIIFYGGEPLMKPDKLKEITNGLADLHEKGQIDFFMQTNGKLLDKVPIGIMKKFSRILVSIDGNRERTDFNRGKGNYDKVLKNLKKIRKGGYKGEVVARMTINQCFPDVEKQIKHLVELIEEGIFDSIHWQIDAGFYKNDFNEKRFKEFVEEYNKNISKLIEFWVEEIKNGRVLKLYPFLGIFESLYYGKKTKLRCGSGYENYTITTNGEIASCPIMNNVKDFYAGDLNSKVEDLKKFDVGGKCISCSYLGICGGRCLYSNQARLWPEEGEDLICKTIIHLIEEIKKKIPEIRKLIEENVVKEEDFKYEKYFGPEIIP